MVDHRAEEDGDFRIFVNEDDQAGFSWSRVKDQISEWVRQRLPQGKPQRRERPAARSTVHKVPEKALEDRGFIPWATDHKVPLAVSALWTLVLGAYGIGYFLRLDAMEGSNRLLPTIDFLFFAFAVAGPIAMIWVVVLMLNRAERLTSAITDQSESALALATTISTLNESVDVLSESTTRRLEDACARMEHDTQQSAKGLSKALDDIATKIDTTILDSVITLDKSNRDRLHQVEAVLAAERAAFADRLDSDAQQMARKIDESTADTRTRLDAAISATMSKYAERLDEVNAQVESVLVQLSEQVISSINDRAKSMDKGLLRQQSELQTTVDAASKSIREGLTRHQETLDQTTNVARQAIDDGMKRHQSVLDAAAERTQSTIQNDLVTPIAKVRASLDETLATLAANPPATSEDLSRLLGTAARDLIAPEREALVKSIERIEGLEQQARSMLVQIDRTSRLNPALADEEPAPLPLSHAARVDDLELPFENLPRSAERSTLDWTAVIEVLDRADPRPANAAAMKTAAEDPDIVALMAAGAAIEADLTEDGVFLEDLRPEHAPTQIWVRFIQGERGDAIRILEGIDDEIASAIVRGKLRRTPGFRSSALKFATLYIGLLERVLDDVGVDQRLVELAETRMGRAFIAVAGPLGLFDQRIGQD